MLPALINNINRDLNLQGRALTFTEKTPLRGALPQLDSMAIVTLVASLEEAFSFEFPEERLDGAVFDSVGSLLNVVKELSGAE
jgi:acyl carrier protein